VRGDEGKQAFHTSSFVGQGNVDKVLESADQSKFSGMMFSYHTNVVEDGPMKCSRTVLHIISHLESSHFENAAYSNTHNIILGNILHFVDDYPSYSFTYMRDVSSLEVTLLVSPKSPISFQMTGAFTRSLCTSSSGDIGGSGGSLALGDLGGRTASPGYL
jgi:hypothetical protein